MLPQVLLAVRESLDVTMHHSQEPDGTHQLFFSLSPTPQCHKLQSQLQYQNNSMQLNKTQAPQVHGPMFLFVLVAVLIIQKVKTAACLFVFLKFS